VVSALQSQLFNEIVARRIAEGQLTTVLDGDVLQRVAGSGPFISEQPEVDQQRLASGEVVITGPICGPRMPRPRVRSPARVLEDLVLEAFDVDPEAFTKFGRLARGGRRPLTVPVSERDVATLPDGALRLRFTLPSGSYATVLLREVTKTV
jgi:tRNA pseudouridine13 synthase